MRAQVFFTLLRAVPSGERALSAVHALRRSIESCLSSPSTKVSQGSNGNDDRQALQSDRQLTVSRLAGLLAFSDTHPSSSLMRLLLLTLPNPQPGGNLSHTFHQAGGLQTLRCSAGKV